MARTDDKQAANAGACLHRNVTCLNQHEIIRKYRCDSCNAVMMCQCNEAFARKFLAHQLEEGCELETQERIPVTHGFQPGVCHECRGLPAPRAPAGEIHGRGSKIKRYYWREIYFETTTRFASWAETNSVPWKSAQWRPEHAEIRKRIEKEVIAELSEQHKIAPKYDWNEPSDAEVLKAHNVEVLEFYVDFSKPSAGQRARVLDGTEWISVEEFVQRHYERQGHTAMPLESRPLHVLFGTFMSELIQDPTDSATRLVGIGIGTPGQISGADMIYMQMPHDFGSPGYSRRRRQAIERHLESLPTQRASLEQLFDYRLQSSWAFRQYLGATSEDDVRRARCLLGVFTPEVVLRILTYLVADYWRRHLGWPDLLVSRTGEYVLVEVKARDDDLTGDQKAWIGGNVQELSLPFRIVKLRKRIEKGRH